MNTKDLIEQLEATAKRSEKEALLYRALTDGERLFFKAAQLACDPLVTFGVQKVAKIEDDDLEAGPVVFSSADFFRLADRLRKRELTGHGARDAINEAALGADPWLWNGLFRRVLLKDLKCGVDAKTINKVLKKARIVEADADSLLVPTFELQLAEDGARPEHAPKIAGQKLLDVKLDGVRVVSILDKETGRVTQMMRSGKINENFGAIREALERLIPELPCSVALDGEVISTSFQDLMTQVNRKGADTQSARLALFDMVPLTDFQNGYCAMRQSDRHSVLSALETSGLLKQHTDSLVYVIPKRSVDLSTQEGKDAFAQFNREAIEAGYEGIMIKDPEAPYEGRRTFSWLKMKPFIEVSLAVTAVEEGDAEGKYLGKMGALVCEGVDDGRKIVVNVGSGFTDAQREEFWERREELIGMIAEVRADVITKDRTSDVFSLRFPRFKGWRGSEPGEKL
jgi:DNA ligase-1